MAKSGVNIEAQTRELINDIRQKNFKPVYLLMGEEPYYPDKICQEIIDHCLEEWEQDFNQTVCYGSDVDAEMVITAARRFPMMAERQLVVVKEAQLMKDIEQLSLYCAQPLDSTVLVVLLHRASVDKRKAFYKAVQKVGVIVDSPAVREYEIVNWIGRYYEGRGLQIEPPAAQLLAESAGTDLGTLVVETDKLLKNLPEGTARVRVEDIEKNVGVSRQFSIFELTKALSSRNARQAVKVASYIGQSARFALPAAVSALFTHFYRILKYEALLAKGGRPSQEEKASVLGVSPYFFREYDEAVRNYPLPKCMAVIALLKEFDFKGKGGDVSQETEAGDLLVELTVSILNI
ncbi:MAG: DNA polymerase III subunit delta [Bacteroidales bacterium]|nr:DNA polymerase III subunit delta [Bacteroidales bacterium]